MALCQLAETLSPLSVPQDSVAIENKRFASDMPAFEFGAAHSSSYPLDDQVALEFGDGPDDDHNPPVPRGTFRVDLLAEADGRLYVEPVEFVQHIEEVPYGLPGDPDRSPDQDDLEAGRVGHRASWSRVRDA